MARRKRQPRRSSERRGPKPTERPAGAPTRSVAVLAGAVLGVVVLAAYLRTATKDIVFGDTPELTAVAATLGVAHPPGYPLWTMLAHLFTLVPIGSLPFRVSAFSCTAAAAAGVVIYAIGYRLSHSGVLPLDAALRLARRTVCCLASLFRPGPAREQLAASGRLRPRPARAFRHVVRTRGGGPDRDRRGPAVQALSQCLLVPRDRVRHLGTGVRRVFQHPHRSTGHPDGARALLSAPTRDRGAARGGRHRRRGGPRSRDGARRGDGCRRGRRGDGCGRRGRELGLDRP